MFGSAVFGPLCLAPLSYPFDSAVSLGCVWPAVFGSAVFGSTELGTRLAPLCLAPLSYPFGSAVGGGAHHPGPDQVEHGHGSVVEQLSVPVAQEQLVPEQLLRRHTQHAHKTLPSGGYTVRRRETSAVYRRKTE